MASLFLSAGRLDWAMAWAYVALYVGMIAINAIVIDRELAAERSGIGEGTKQWDRTLASLSLLLVTPGALSVSGLDERFGWSRLPTTIQFIALVAGTIGGLYPSWRATRMRPVEALRYE